MARFPVQRIASFHSHTGRSGGPVCRKLFRSTRVLPFIALGAALALQSTQVNRVAAAFQGLEGTTLRAVEDGETLLGGVLELLGGREPRRGRTGFERVVIAEESARRLTVTITYSGLSNLQLAGDMRGRDRRRQPHVQVEPVALTADAGEAQLTFELHPSVPKGTTIESAYMRLTVMDPGRGSMPVLSRAYELGKTWNATAEPSNVVITVVPKAVGTAAALGARPDYAPPPKVLVPIGGIVRSPGSAQRTADSDRTGGTGTIQRDHRTGSAETSGRNPRVGEDREPRSGTVTVRDRRTGEVETREPGRDHRDGATRERVRDHRDDGAGTARDRPRDHRTGGAEPADGDSRSGTVTVRDHRTGEVATRERVRDHRDGGAGTARDRPRDHRTRGAEPADGDSRSGTVTVRDHRTGEVETRRDHRTRHSREVADRTRPASTRLAPNSRLVTADRFRYGIKPEDAQKGAQGPVSAPIELLEGLRTEDIDLDPASLLNIATSIYPDKNPASGIFYYHPRSYHLEWTPESGHGMRILYGASTGDGTAGEVLMATRLRSGLDLSEVRLATELLNAYKRRNPTLVFTALRPLPLEKDGMDVSIGSTLGQYSIAKEKVAITALSDVLGEIEVSWVTDPVTKENLQLALVEGVGVSGDVAFAAAGGSLVPQVPISIKLADRESFGRLRWDRAQGARNQTPYPLRLRYLHALCIDPRTNLPILYTWSLGDTEVPPLARVRWEAAPVPAWIDTDAKRIWIDYGVSQNCDACDRHVLDGITGGVTSVAAEQITFHTITPLADAGAYEITAQVRSKFFDPKNRAVVQKFVVLGADNKDFTLGPIHTSERKDGEALFEYTLDLALPDGSTQRGTQWIRSEALRVVVGTKQLEQSLGTLAGPAPEPRP